MLLTCTYNGDVLGKEFWNFKTYTVHYCTLTRSANASLSAAYAPVASDTIVTLQGKVYTYWGHLYALHVPSLQTNSLFKTIKAALYTYSLCSS